jgi:uncharacterized protein HemX
MFRNGTWDEWKGYVPSLIYNKGKNPLIDEGEMGLKLEDTSISSSTSTTNNNGLIIGVVIAVVAVVALGGVGYFVYASRKAKRTNRVQTISVK